MKPQTVVEKIVQGAVASSVAVSQRSFVNIRPLHVMTHDNTHAVLSKFRQLGAKRVANASQPVFALDHNVQDCSKENLARYAEIEEFAKQQHISFYPAGRGIGHQVMIEEGFAQPGSLCVASDSHSNMYGAVGCLGSPVVRTDAAAIWATGSTWWQVPPVVRVRLFGALPEGATGKDLVLSLCANWPEFATNACVEFEGEGCSSLSVEERLTVANMTTEWGALAGVFPVDDKTRTYLKLPDAEAPLADRDAYYERTLELDLSSVAPIVSGPNTLRNAHSVYALEQQRLCIQKAYILSCVNGRQGDLRAAARVLKGKKVHPDVELWVSAASSVVQADCEKDGSWASLVQAGAHVLPPGCGPCIGLGAGLLEDGEVGISATNRNFTGRMGHRNAQAYLSSPAIVAASAIKGYISAASRTDGLTNVRGTVQTAQRTAAASEPTKLIEGFPKSVSGGTVCCLIDNMNTDGIYAGVHTYVSLSPDEQARVAFENYDPSFSSVARSGDLLIGGFNWGVGSSREQAATALLHYGIRLVVCGSVSETYKRNALNNGLLLIEVPELVIHLQQSVQPEKTVRLDQETRVDFETSQLSHRGVNYPFAPIGEIAQELIKAGGLESWVKSKI